MRRTILLLALSWGLAGCWAFLGGPPEDRARRILSDYRPKVEKPTVVPRPETELPAERGIVVSGKLDLTLEEAFTLSAKGNRDFLSQKEGLTLAALSLAGAQYEWEPQLVTTMNYLVTNARREQVTGASSGSITGGITQKLPLGGSLSLQGSTAAATHHSDKTDRSATTGFSLSWEQPLLRDFGPTAALNGLVQARRTLLYELRDFELYRQSFALDTLSRFFELVRMEDGIRNSERNFETYRQQHLQALALFEVDRVPEIDVLRAERESEQARNDLEIARDVFAAALDSFKVYLGLDPATDMSLKAPAWMLEARAAVPPREGPEKFPFPLSECLRAARANRLDLKSIRDRLEDARRDVSIARNRMLPDFKFTFGFGLDHPPVQDYNDQAFQRHVQAGFSLGIPWDFRPEHDALFSARVAEERGKRAVDLKEEQIRQEVRNLFRSANQVRVTLHIQNKIRLSAEKRLEIAKFRFQEGEIGNRDVMEATDALLQAENQYTQALVEERLRDLELAKAAGILVVRPDGRPEILGWPIPEGERNGG